MDTGLTNTFVFALAVSSATLFAGTYADGVWRRPLSDMTSVQGVATSVPKTFALSQNYPNPFNPSTTLKYEWPRASMVRLSVYDILGREVSVLVNGRNNAGAYEVNFDATRLSSGVYIFRLQAGDFVDSKKMLLIK